ncbi:unnamed protein product [[Candida] boidinii]|uniref:Unnamed protein product n=1 Tax=Candida boidinii TaxID=5477 RepID=A0A9W6WK25_CANBO|nr:unnamed protein product [[Candida] boidinii]
MNSNTSNSSIHPVNDSNSSNFNVHPISYLNAANDSSINNLIDNQQQIDPNSTSQHQQQQPQQQLIPSKPGQQQAHQQQQQVQQQQQAQQGASNSNNNANNQHVNANGERFSINSTLSGTSDSTDSPHSITSSYTDASSEGGSPITGFHDFNSPTIKSSSKINQVNQVNKNTTTIHFLFLFLLPNH